MLSLKLPIPIQSILSHPPITNHASYFHSHRYQTHRLPSQPVTVTKRGSVAVPPNVVLRDDGTSLAGDSAEEEPIPSELRVELMPKHVAVIMDGNRRWAKMRGLTRWEGHEAGLRSLIRFVRLCSSWAIKVITVFMFSTDNWVRPKVDVEFLFILYERFKNSEIEAFKREGDRISVIGDLSKLPKSLQTIITCAEESTKDNWRLHVIMAVSYGGKYDVLQACKSVAQKVKDGILDLEEINENIIEQELETNCTEFPYPDPLIRTSGELRVSNFLLWQMAYTELFFHRVLWPDFGKDAFAEALSSFQRRQRRYGGQHS